MEGDLKLSTAANVTVLIVDSSDHVTGKTGLAAGLTIYAIKAAGTPATITPTVTELDATNVKGVYKLALTSSHTDTLGEFALHITASGADPTDLKWQVSTNLAGESSLQTGDSFARIGAAGAGLTALGDTRIANLDAAVTTRMATYTQPTGFLAATFPSGTVANTTNITAGTITTATNLTTNNDKTGYALSSGGVQAIWDALTSALTTSGSIGKKLADWVIGTTQTGDSFARIGAAGAGLTALGDTRIANLDAAVSTRMASYTQPTGFLAATFPSGTVANTTNITAGTITTATNLTTNNDKTGYALTSGERNSVADALLDRDMSTGTDSGSPTVRTPRQALRALRNKVSVSGATLTVTTEDDSTASWTATVSTTPGADPVTGIDPAGP